MATYVFSRNGMGNYTTGTGMREDMHMQYANILNYRAGVVLTTDLAVTERGAGANMSVDVSAGRCFIQNSSYTANTANSTKYWGLLSDAVTNLAISTNTSGSTRIDKIVAKIDTTAIANDYATNVGSIIVVEGTPGAGAPATPSNCLLLATLTIPTGTTVSITNAMITNGRVYPGLTFQTAYMIDDGTNLELHSTTGNIHIYDSSRDVHLRIYDSAGGSGFLDLYHDGSNGNINTGAGDLDIVPAGGDVRLRSGTDLQIFDNANTASAEIAMGTNLDITTTSGDISLTPTGGDVNLTTGTNLVMFNAANTQTFTIDVGTNTEFLITTGNLHVYDASHDVQLRIYDSAGGSSHIDLYHNGDGRIATSAGDLYLAPAGLDVRVTADIIPTADNTYDLGELNARWQVGYFHNVSIFEAGSTTSTVEFLQTSTYARMQTTQGDIRLTTSDAGTGIDLDTGSSAEWVLLPNVTADPGTLSDGMIWYRSDTDTLHLRANGVTRTFTVT